MKLAWIGWTLRRGGARLLRRAGWGRLLIACFLVLLVSIWAAHWHLRTKLRAEQRASAIAAKKPQAPGLWAPANRTLDQDLQAFEARLPSTDEGMQILAALFTLAEKHKLALARGDYKLQPDATANFVRFRMSLPMKGEARVIQRFVQEAMLAHPTLAFDSITFKRDRVDAQMVEAKIQWTLIMRAAAPSKPISPVAPGTAPTP